VAAKGNGAAWASLVVGLAAVATMPLAIYLTRLLAAYELGDAAFAIPVAAALGVVAIVLSRSARRRSALSLGRVGGGGVARAGRVLGIAGVCIALAALVSVAVYGLLEYAGTRD